METLERKGMIGAVNESGRPSRMPLIGTEGTAAVFTELREGAKVIAKGNQWIAALRCIEDYIGGFLNN